MSIHHRHTATPLSHVLVEASRSALGLETDRLLLQAPCAQSALSYNILSQTYDACPEAVTDLQSCVCTKNNNFASISSKISLSISYSCGSTASDDQTSAQSVSIVECLGRRSTPD